MNNVYIGIGSNVGERLTNIRKTIEELENNSEISNIKISSIYETKPYGNIEQNNFLNAVIYFETSFELDELLSFTKSIEKKIGRIKKKIGDREK
ncbi:MAG: 2-amino-4-hydroxy-6-hydroxymethyldihydropteridine diphosphokinase [Ignavibacteriales bacterium]|nr:2-amino-4-hydroxy-6-hydroxymethyldihydropteridine diphosphokinase [Ignavibacteriales bacterium]